MEQNRRFGKKAKVAAVLGVMIITITFLSVGLYYPFEKQFGVFTINYEFHCWIEQYRDGKLISQTYHAMTLTNYGKDQIEKLLGGEVTDAFKYHACSNSSDDSFATDTSLDEEITTDGLARAVATYANTGTGTWNMTNTWTVTGTNSTKLYGVYSESTGANLCLAEQQGAGNQKNVIAGDTIKMTVQGTVS